MWKVFGGPLDFEKPVSVETPKLPAYLLVHLLGTSGQAPVLFKTVHRFKRRLLGLGQSTRCASRSKEKPHHSKSLVEPKEEAAF